MAFKPVFENKEDKLMAEVEKRLNNILAERDKIAKDVADKAKTEKESGVVKIQKALEEIKATTIKTAEVAKKAEENDILCPTCHKGHIHKLSSDGMVAKCTGEGCTEEYILVPKSSDYKCIGCGLPIKKLPGDKQLDDCPFCGSTKAKKFDFTMVRKQTK
jgi:DNA-directed RNA polymerase subunit RPC12/RpoP/ElaB/YqjD/DUF883 family membrane-anchored ribosome-binding protein